MTVRAGHLPFDTVLDGVKDAASAKAADAKIRDLTARAKAARESRPRRRRRRLAQFSGLADRADRAMQGIPDDRSPITARPSFALIGKDLDNFIAAWSGTPIEPMI